LEGAPDVQSQLDQAPGPRHGIKHPRHQLALCSPKTQKITLLFMEEHSKRMDECQTKFVQIRTHHLCGVIQATHSSPIRRIDRWVSVVRTKATHLPVSVARELETSGIPKRRVGKALPPSV
jgi:hypothetical protein